MSGNKMTSTDQGKTFFVILQSTNSSIMPTDWVRLAAKKVRFMLIFNQIVEKPYYWVKGIFFKQMLFLGNT